MDEHRNVERNATLQRTLCGLLTVILALTGCATTKTSDQHAVAGKIDPYEAANRKVYYFNDKLDDYVAAPIADAYRTITPQFVQTGIFNFFNNLKNVNVVLNDVLQGKFQQSGEDTRRFAMNSTLGLLGVFDVAKTVGLQQNNEDFDQTLAVWCVPRGPYLVIPFLGPTTLRGIPGAMFDTAANPSNYVGVPVQLVSLLNTRANAEGALKFIHEAAIDPYVFTRESFLQWRESLATDGKAQEYTDLEDELGEEDSTQPAPKASGGALKLGFSANTQTFKQVSQSFSSIARSLDNTATSFQETGEKLDKLKKK
jgi:phospholipid-binding lipoprotein MlaA